MGAIIVSVMVIVIALISLAYFNYQDKKEAKRICDNLKNKGEEAVSKLIGILKQLLLLYQFIIVI